MDELGLAGLSWPRIYVVNTESGLDQFDAEIP